MKRHENAPFPTTIASLFKTKRANRSRHAGQSAGSSSARSESLSASTRPQSVLAAPHAPSVTSYQWERMTLSRFDVAFLRPLPA